MRFEGYPSAQEFNEAVEQIIDDLGGLYAHMDRIRADLIHLAGGSDLVQQQTELQIRGLEERLTRLTKQAQGQDAVVFCETFTGTENYDLDRVRGTPAEVAADQGVLCLARESGREYQGQAQLRIVGGNGFPGDTHQLLADGSTFAGSNGAHADLGAVVDSNADTWFEYEIFEPTQIPMPFVAYREGCSWLQRNSGGLRLELELTLAKPEIVNWITLNPYTPGNAGATASTLEWVILDDNHGSRQGIPGSLLNREKVFWAAPQEVAKVRFNIVQLVPYPVEVGLLGDIASVRHLGLTYDARGGTLIQPTYSPGQSLTAEADIARAYFAQPARVLQARRYDIGLRDIKIAGYRFAPSSNYVSKPFCVEEGISSLRLKPEVSLPPGNFESDWVKFSISIDDGQTYLPIALPWDLAGVHEYVFGDYPPMSLRKLGTVYMGGNKPQSVRVQIELNRPLEGPMAPYLGPLVHGYLLTAKTGDVSYDY